MSLYRIGCCMGTVIILTTCLAQSAPPSSAIKMSSVASANDLATEVIASVTELEQLATSPEAFSNNSGKRHLEAAQLAILAQALAEHDQDSKLKYAAPSLRDAALKFGSGSYEDSPATLKTMRAAIEGHDISSTQVDHDWTRLATVRELMSLLRQRTDNVRKTIRRSKDPSTESRKASVMAVLMVAVAAHHNDPRYSAGASTWHQLALESQAELTETSAAIRQQEATAVVERFTAAQAACDRCHEKFKR